MAIKKEGFFGTDNLHRAGWTIVVGVIGFIGTLGYQNIYGPPRVVVETPAPNHSEVKVIPRTELVHPTSEEISESSSENTSPPVTLPVTKSSVLPVSRRLDPKVLRSQIAIADQIYGVDTRNAEYTKIIDRALIINELDLALLVTDKLYGVDVRNDNYEKIIHRAISLKKLDLASQAVSKIYGVDRKNADLKLLLDAEEN